MKTREAGREFMRNMVVIWRKATAANTTAASQRLPIVSLILNLCVTRKLFNLSSHGILTLLCLSLLLSLSLAYSVSLTSSKAVSISVSLFGLITSYSPPPCLLLLDSVIILGWILPTLSSALCCVTPCWWYVAAQWMTSTYTRAHTLAQINTYR